MLGSEAAFWRKKPLWLEEKHFDAFQDIELVSSDGKRFQANKSVLACMSSFLKIALETESDDILVHLDVQSDILQVILHFARSGSLPVPYFNASFKEILRYLGIDLDQMTFEHKMQEEEDLPTNNDLQKSEDTMGMLLVQNGVIEHKVRLSTVQKNY